MSNEKMKVWRCGCFSIDGDGFSLRPPPNGTWLATDIGNDGECLFCNRPIEGVTIAAVLRENAALKLVFEAAKNIVDGSGSIWTGGLGGLEAAIAKHGEG